MTGTPSRSIIYLPHGGGPLPVLGHAGHRELVDFLREIGQRLPEPEAIVVISAHWEADVPTITSAAVPEIIYDYYGFPEAAYHLRYDAPGAPELAGQIAAQIRGNGMEARLDSGRGFDHGLYIPLMLMFPEAHIPCLQVSLIRGLDPARHIELGIALRAMRKNNVLLVGSGMSFHNMHEFFPPGTPGSNEKSMAFDEWLVETCTASHLSPAERRSRLEAWEKAPFGRFCHPREEHLLPLHVCYGSSGADPAKLVFNGEVLGKRVSALLWD